jgi:hypothetical protein
MKGTKMAYWYYTKDTCSIVFVDILARTMVVREGSEVCVNDSRKAVVGVDRNFIYFEDGERVWNDQALREWAL